MSSEIRPWLSTEKGGQTLLLRVKVQPRASRTEIREVIQEPVSSGGKSSASAVEERLKIQLMAPPVDGEANEALLKFLRKHLSLPGGALELIRGQTSREKELRIHLGSASEAEIRRKLLAG